MQGRACLYGFALDRRQASGVCFVCVYLYSGVCRGGLPSIDRIEGRVRPYACEWKTRRGERERQSADGREGGPRDRDTHTERGGIERERVEKERCEGMPGVRWGWGEV